MNIADLVTPSKYSQTRDKVLLNDQFQALKYPIFDNSFTVEVKIAILMQNGGVLFLHHLQIRLL
jgi:hypothetical protein